MQTTLERPSIATRNAKTETTAKQAWLSERRSYIGATDCGAILGCNPYKSAHDVWLDKKGFTKDESNIAMRHGSYVESFIASEFQRETGIKILRSKLYRHPKFEFLACNPDREVKIAGVEGLLECKSVGYFASKNFGQDGSDQIPEHYLMQVLWQLIITRKEFCQLAALVDNRELRIFTYSLNPAYSERAHIFPQELATSVFKACIRWWERYMLGDEEPPMSGHDSDTEWLQANRPSYDNGLMTNTDEATDILCRKLQKRIVRTKRAQLIEAETKNRIKKFMADRGASDLESTVGMFTWRTDKRGVASLRTPFGSNKA